MSERKVLNKYYPPDFDPSKIPRMKCAKNRQFTVRLMAPFNMRCKTCGEYIYKGKKFNARKEDVEGEDYLGIRIFRFYIKCTRCLQEISFKTDPRNTDYEIEAGATRNFMALKLAEEQAEREEEERKEEEASNPMKLLENRTQQSKQELELLESLEELRDLNKRQQSVDFDSMLSQFNTREAAQKLAKLQEEEDEKYVKSVFGKGKRVVKEIIYDEDGKKISKKKLKASKSSSKTTEASSSKTTEASSSTFMLPAPVGGTPSSVAIDKVSQEKSASLVTAPIAVAKPGTKYADESWNKSLGIIKRSGGLSNLVQLKKADEKSSETKSASGSSSALSMLGSYSGSSDSNDSS